MGKKLHSYGDPTSRPAAEELEATFHKKIATILPRKQQGYVMGAWRESQAEFDIIVKRVVKPEEKDPYQVGFESGYDGGVRATDCPYDAPTDPDRYTDWHQGFDHGWKTASMHEDQMRGDPSHSGDVILIVLFAIVAILVFAWNRGWLI